TGEYTIGRITLGMTPVPVNQPPASQLTASMWLPETASAAPIKPPIKAWLELDGRPRRQVTRFQMMAEESAQMMSCGPMSTTPAFSRPEAIVAATAVPISAPNRLVTAASNTAWPGESTLVATTVAIELAVSWKPLMEVKASANSTSA